MIRALLASTLVCLAVSANAAEPAAEEGRMAEPAAAAPMPATAASAPALAPAPTLPVRHWCAGYVHSLTAFGESAVSHAMDVTLTPLGNARNSVHYSVDPLITPRYTMQSMSELLTMALYARRPVVVAYDLHKDKDANIVSVTTPYDAAEWKDKKLVADCK